MLHMWIALLFIIIRDNALVSWLKFFDIHFVTPHMQIYLKNFLTVEDSVKKATYFSKCVFKTFYIANL